MRRLRERSRRTRTRAAKRKRNHPGRAIWRARDTAQRQEIARLWHLYKATGDNSLLGQIGLLRDELDRSCPMPVREGSA